MAVLEIIEEMDGQWSLMRWSNEHCDAGSFVGTEPTMSRLIKWGLQYADREDLVFPSAETVPLPNVEGAP